MTPILSLQLQKAYERRRNTAEIRRADFRERMAERDPQLADMLRQRQAEGLRRVMSALGGETAPADAASEWQPEALDAAIEARFLTIEEEHGFQPWHCSRCCDTGIYEGDRCSCATDLLTEEEERTGISFPAPSGYVLEAFDPSLFNDSLSPNWYGGKTSPLQAASAYRRRVTNYCENFPQDTASFYFFGPTGTGKTWFISAMAHAIRERGYAVSFLRVSAYLDLKERLRVLEHSYYPDEEELNLARENVAVFENAELLVLDDLGAEAGGKQAYSDLVSLLDYRMETGRLPTLLSGNLKPAEISRQYDERLGSRILRCRLMPLEGDDLRYRLAAKKRERLEVRTEDARS